MGRRKKLAPVVTAEGVPSTFGHIVDVIKDKGRVAGFEEMRDYVLLHWDTLKGQINPYSAIKLVLEADRHSLFAEVAELRKQGNQAAELSAELSDYLKGNIDLSPDSTGERITIPHDDDNETEVE